MKPKSSCIRIAAFSMGLAFVITVILLLFQLEDTVHCEFGEEVEDSLQHVSIVFRHGDRTPDLVDLYPNDPNAGETYYPYGHGQLTNTGKQRQFRMGQEMYKRYHKYLGPTYLPDAVKAITSDFGRTKMSLQLMLATLFPPEGEWAWDDKFPWQPIPYDYTKYKDDYLFLAGRLCPQIMPAFKAIFKDDKVRKSITQYHDAIVKFNKSAGIDLYREPQAAWNSYITLGIQQELGLKLSEDILEVFPHPLEEIAHLQYELFTYNTHLKRLISGPLFTEMMKESILKAEGKTPGKKMSIYSAHEVHLAGLLRIVESFYPHMPPYSAYFLLELHKMNDGHYYKMFYQDYKQKEPRVLKLSNCAELCPYEDFIASVQDFYFDLERDCL